MILACCFIFARPADGQNSGGGPFDKLRQDFLSKTATHTFQISQIQVTGRIVAIDTSRATIYRELMAQKPASRTQLGNYIQSVVLDDGQSETRAACSMFEKDGSQEDSLLVSLSRLSLGDTITVSGTFLGAYQPGAVEMMKCSLVGKSTNNGQGPEEGSRPTPQIHASHQAQGTEGRTSVSAGALLAEAKGDMATFHRKYAGRPLVITGQVDWTYGILDNPGGVVLMGKFHEDGDIFCDLVRHETAQLSKGQVITVAGKFAMDRVYWDQEENIRFSHNSNVQLISCQILDFNASIPEDMRAPGPRPLGRSSVALSGLYLRADTILMAAGLGLQTTWHFYLFSPDGHVYTDFPKNGQLDHFDFADAAKRDPRSTGYYRVAGNQIEFVWFAGRKPERSEFQQKEDSLVFLGTEWKMADTDARRHRPNWLLGTYRSQMGGTMMGTVSAMGQSFYTWNANGTFSTTTTGMATNGAAVPQANSATSSDAAGTYILSGTTLTLKFSGGRTEQHTVFPYGDAIFFDGRMFIHPH